MQVTVVIPTYKHQDYVLRSLASVFAQTFTDYEVVVINDGSPDDTDAVLRPLAEAGKIRYFRQENAGQGAARNRGIAEGRGEFIALLDDDDLWPPDKLKWQVQALQSHSDAALVYGSVQVVDGNDKFFTPTDAEGKPPRWLTPGPSGDVYESLMQENPIISPGACLMRRRCLEALGDVPFDPDIRGGSDDYDLYLRLARKFPFLYIDQVGLYYRLHGSNASGDTAKVWLSILAVQQKMYRTETDPALRRRWKQTWDGFATYVVRFALQSVEGKTSGSENLPRASALRLLSELRSYIPAAVFAEVRVRLGKFRQRFARG